MGPWWSLRRQTLQSIAWQLVMGCPLRTAVAKLVFVTRCGPDRGQLQFDICVIEWDRHTAKVHSTATQHSWSAAAFLCHSDTSNKFDWQATSIADRGTALFVVAEEHSFAKACHRRRRDEARTQPRARGCFGASRGEAFPRRCMHDSCHFGTAIRRACVEVLCR